VATPKLDGWHARWDPARGELLTRSGAPLLVPKDADSVHPLTRELRARAADLRLEGEAYAASDWRERRRAADTASLRRTTRPLFLWVFDAPDAPGRLRERLELARRRLAGLALVRVVPASDDPRALFEAVRAAGGEGIVARDDAPYGEGRGFKIKPSWDATALVLHRTGASVSCVVPKADGALARGTTLNLAARDRGLRPGDRVAFRYRGVHPKTGRPTFATLERLVEAAEAGPSGEPAVAWRCVGSNDATYVVHRDHRGRFGCSRVGEDGARAPDMSFATSRRRLGLSRGSTCKHVVAARAHEIGDRGRALNAEWRRTGSSLSREEFADRLSRSECAWVEVLGEEVGPRCAGSPEAADPAGPGTRAPGKAIDTQSQPRRSRTQTMWPVTRIAPSKAGRRGGGGRLAGGGCGCGDDDDDHESGSYYADGDLPGVLSGGAHCSWSATQEEEEKDGKKGGKKGSKKGGVLSGAGHCGGHRRRKKVRWEDEEMAREGAPAATWPLTREAGARPYPK